MPTVKVYSKCTLNCSRIELVHSTVPTRVTIKEKMIQWRNSIEAFCDVCLQHQTRKKSIGGWTQNALFNAMEGEWRIGRRRNGERISSARTLSNLLHRHSKEGKEKATNVLRKREKSEGKEAYLQSAQPIRFNSHFPPLLLWMHFFPLSSRWLQLSRLLHRLMSIDLSSSFLASASNARLFSAFASFVPWSADNLLIAHLITFKTG